ncbi:MAG TPA: ABC transporter ATP-binding protein [Chloroflexota bacterium]|jgi:molybdate transport system ATP-binding protein|nr:ABC transporter ATP-binding protein [Chloroflexota bacterium]
MLEVAIRKRLREFQLAAAFSAGNELVVFFGPSGAGKTVTLRCIAGLLRPDAGYIALAGQAVFDAAHGIDVPVQRRRVGYVPQHYGLFPHLTVAENVAYGLRGVPRAEARARVAAMLARLELTGLERRRPRELSGGQQQRVALARALVTRPQVLLLDEPLSALDAGLRARLRRDLLQVHRQIRIPTVLVSHDLAEAYMLGERIVVFDRGQVLQVGSREEVWYRPASARVARLVGATNVLPADVAPEGPDGLVTLRTPRFALHARAPAGPLPPRVEVVVRPEAIRVERAEAPGAPSNRLPARIVDEIATGAYYTLYCQVEPAQPAAPPDLEVLVPAPHYVALDLAHTRACALVIPPEAIHLLPAA